MTDANEKSNQDNKEKENEIYTEFKKSLSLIDKSIILKDLKTLDINYRLINLHLVFYQIFLFLLH